MAFSSLSFKYLDCSELNSDLIPIEVELCLLKFHELRKSDCRNCRKKKLETAGIRDKTKLAGKISK